jgi:hypothetical protein
MGGAKKMSLSAAYRQERLHEFLGRRKLILSEWTAIHPEGITAENHAEAIKYFKKREREIKKEPRP